MSELIYQLQQFPKLISAIPDNKIILGNSYYQMGLKGTLPEMYIREGVWKQLSLAKELLPNHLAFYLFDTYRSLETQKDLFLYMKTMIQNQHPSLSEDALMSKTRTFVADPFNLEIRHKLSHPTGAAVDLSLYDLEKQQLVDMGTPFDDPTEQSATNYFEKYESSTEKEFHSVRMILHQTMLHVGFTNYAKEWWHYDLGDYSWSHKNGHTWYYDIIEKIS